MNESIFNFVGQFNWQTILSMAAILWYFNHSLNSKFEKMDERWAAVMKDLSDYRKESSDQWVSALKEIHDYRKESSDQWVSALKEIHDYKKESDQRFYELLKQNKHAT